MKIINKLATIQKILFYSGGGVNEKGEIINKKMTLADACQKADVNYLTLRTWLRNDPELQQEFTEARLAQKEANQLIARDNIYDAISGKKRLREKDVVDISFRFLEKTDKEFQPTQIIEQKGVNLNVGVSNEDLEERIKELLFSK